jgi:hypothetical protein
VRLKELGCADAQLSKKVTGGLIDVRLRKKCRTTKEDKVPGLFGSSDENIELKMLSF